MDLTETVSPIIAVPVICVLVCLLVFAFGFKSPTQPPNFDVFDDDARKKKGKKSKGIKTQSNGHTVTASGDNEVVSSAKPTASPKQAAKQPAKPSKTKPTPAAPVDKKTKKSATKDSKVLPAVPEDKKPGPNVFKEEEIYSDDWETVPKKEKKEKKQQKKKEVEPKKESPVREESVVVKEPMVVKEAEFVVTTEPEVEALPPPSPSFEEQRGKKKEKKNKKAKEEIVEPVKPKSSQVEATVIPAVVKSIPPAEVKSTPPAEVKSTPPAVVKSTLPAVVKSSTPAVVKSIPVAVAMVTKPAPAPVEEPSIETLIQEAMDTTVEKASPVPEKRNKKKKKKAPAEEDDFVIPDSALKPASIPVAEVEPSPALVDNTEALTVKNSKKKQKKDKSKRLEEKPDKSGAAADSLSTVSKKPQAAEPPAADTHPRLASPSDDPAPDGGQTAPSFDEMGAIADSWTEAKPKSKKKKARRAD